MSDVEGSRDVRPQPVHLPSLPNMVPVSSYCVACNEVFMQDMQSPNSPTRLDNIVTYQILSILDSEVGRYHFSGNGLLL